MVVSFSSCHGKETPLPVQLVSFKISINNLKLTQFFFHHIDSPTEVTQNPMPKEDEINWILDEVSHYLSAGK